MKYRTRINYTEERKALIWDRWQKETLCMISIACLTAIILQFRAYFPGQVVFVL
jgi:hypothetical protein